MKLWGCGMNSGIDEQSAAENFNRVYQFTGELIMQGEKPTVVAATLLLVALQMYKSILNQEDYDKMVETISENRNQVKSLFEMNKSWLN